LYTAIALHDRDEISGALGMPRSGNGGDRQRQRFSQDGMAELLRSLIEDTAVSMYRSASVAA
jgi:hypothetical protein